MTASALRGYTLVELLVVLSVLGILAGMAMPLAQMVAQRDRERELKRALWEVRDAIDAWHQAARAGLIAMSPSGRPYPPSLEALARAYPDPRPERRGQTLRFLRSVPRDPFADPSLPAEKTWALRGYDSEPHAPKPGGEVYDIRSRHEGIGLNGVPLAQW